MVPTNGQYVVGFEGVPAAGVDIHLTLRGQHPVEIELRGMDGAPASGTAIEALSRRLPNSDWMEPWMEPFARTIDAAKKYVVSSTLDRADWNAEIIRGDQLGGSGDAV
jgi:hypothetical protein